MELIEVILSKENLNRAYKKVVANKGASGVDGVTVEELGGIIELVYIVLQSVVKPGITGFFKIDLHIKCYIYLS